MNARKKRRKTWSIPILIILLICLFRAPVYRVCFQYTNLREIPVKTDAKLGAELSKKVSREADNVRSVKSFGVTAQQIATGHLEFKLKASDQYDLAAVQRTGKANCVGYAALTALVAHQLIEEAGAEHLEVMHCRGKICFFGWDWQTALGVPGWMQDHDYVLIRDVRTGKTRAFDPTLYDYARIRYVNI